MSAVEKLIEQVRNLEETIRQDAIRDVALDLEDAGKAGPGDGDVDTWRSGWTAAIEFVRTNY